MNANELAEKLKTLYFWLPMEQRIIAQNSAAMLRQQQAEKQVSENLIRHLHAENKDLRIENEQQQAEIEALKESLTEAQQEALNWEDRYRSIT